MSRTILITGASTGLGAAMAQRLAADNCIVVHFNRSAPEAQQVARQVKQAGGTAVLVQADLSCERGCDTVAQAVANSCDGRLDVLINNAGSLIRRQAVRDLSWDLMQQTFSLNVFSVMRVTALCIPYLEKGDDPNIINISSIAMRHGAPTATIYGATKGALDSFTRGAAKELAPTIRVNAIAPGVIETPFHEAVSTAEQLERFRASTPLQRNGQAIHIARAAQFLIENDFVTGETIDVNGGLFMH